MAIYTKSLQMPLLNSCNRAEKIRTLILESTCIALSMLVVLAKSLSAYGDICIYALC